jgi:hypothetical protein
LKGDDFLRPTAKQLFLEVSPLLDEPTATRTLMEKEFFSSIRLSNGVHKTTSPLRLDDANQRLIAVFQKLGVAPETFLDVAVSSGISTIEWFESLQQAQLRPSMTATDLTMAAYLVRMFHHCAEHLSGTGGQCTCKVVLHTQTSCRCRNGPKV